MNRRHSLIAAVVALVTLCVVATSPVLAGKRTRDRAALQAVQQRLDRDIERRIDSLL